MRDLQTAAREVCASEIPGDVLRKLALRYGAGQVKEKLHLLSRMSGVTNATGWLVSALKNDYKKVPGLPQVYRRTIGGWPGKKNGPAERRLTEDRYSEKEREIIRSLYLS